MAEGFPPVKRILDINKTSSLYFHLHSEQKINGGGKKIEQVVNVINPI